MADMVLRQSGIRKSGVFSGFLWLTEWYKRAAERRRERATTLMLRTAPEHLLRDVGMRDGNRTKGRRQ